MNRSRGISGKDDGAAARIVWRHGPFLVECTGRGAEMELRVYYERSVMARETVASAELAWTRASDICRQLGTGDAYERGSA